MIALCEHNLKYYKFGMQNYFVDYWAIRYNSHAAGTCDNVFNPVQIEYDWYIKLHFEDMLTLYQKYKIMHLKVMRNPVIN